MSEVDRARRARERGDGRTWRERALAAEADREALRGALLGISGFAESLTERHTGFVHIKRRADAAVKRAE